MDELQPTQPVESVSESSDTQRTPKKIRTPHLLFFLILGFIVSGLGVYALAYTKMSHPSLSTVPTPMISTTPTPITWHTYTDSEIGFTIQYPEPKNPAQKNTFPVKQYISNNLSDGYRLQLTNDVMGKGYYFVMTFTKNTTTDFLTYWKQGQTKGGSFSFDSCTQTTCTGHYRGSKNSFTYDLAEVMVAGKKAFTIKDRLTNYTDGIPLFTQRLYLRQNDYLIEIDKGESDEATYMLNSLTFL
jgi:hypothetical protein